MTPRWSKGTDHYRPSGRMIRRHLSPGGGEKLFGRREHFWQRRSFKIYAAGGLVILGLLTYAVIWSGTFNITTIKVEGTTNLEPTAIESLVASELDQSRWFVFPRRQLFFVDTNNIEQVIRDHYVIDGVRVDRHWFKTLRVTIAEKNAQLTFLSDDRYYVLDPNGIAIRELLVAHVTLVAGEPADETTATAGETMIDRSALDSSIPIVQDLTDAPVTINEVIIPPHTIAFIQNIAKQFPAPLTVNHFVLPSREGSEVHAVTDQGWAVYFDAKDDAAQQLANLGLIYREKVKDKNIEYIDLRFGSKVYVK